MRRRDRRRMVADLNRSYDNAMGAIALWMLAIPAVCLIAVLWWRSGHP
jgi:uncharacterized membrane-anchored protein